MTTERKQEASLQCIIEEKFFYFGVFNSDQELIESDHLDISNGGDLFSNPYLIIAYMDQKLSSYNLTRVQFGVINQNFALIPKDITISDALQWMDASGKESDGLYLDELEYLNVVYQAPQALIVALHKKYVSASLQHIVSINIKNNYGKSGVFSFRINGFQLLQVNDNNGRLQYSNIFESKTVNSSLYYTLLPYHMHQLDRESDTLHLNNRSDTILNDKLSKYVRFIEVLGHTSNQAHQSELTEDQLFQLHNLAICES